MALVEVHRCDRCQAIMADEPVFEHRVRVEARDYNVEMNEFCESCDNDVGTLLAILVDPNGVGQAIAINEAVKEVGRVGQDIDTVTATLSGEPTVGQMSGLIPATEAPVEPEARVLHMADETRGVVLRRLKKLEVIIGSSEKAKSRKRVGIGEGEELGDLDDQMVLSLYDHISSTYPGVGA